MSEPLARNWSQRNAGATVCRTHPELPPISDVDLVPSFSLTSRGAARAAAHTGFRPAVFHNRPCSPRDGCSSRFSVDPRRQNMTWSCPSSTREPTTPMSTSASITSSPFHRWIALGPCSPKSATSCPRTGNSHPCWREDPVFRRLSAVARFGQRSCSACRA